MPTQLDRPPADAGDPAPLSPRPAAGGSHAESPFRWGDVAPDHRDWLQKRTEDLVGLAYRQACDTVRIGAVLEEVRKAIGHGLYQQWVRDQMPFCVQHARRYRQVARAFAAFQSAQFARFEPSALYVLAKTQGVKPEVRAHAVQLAEAGEHITRARALQIVAAHKAKVWETGRERKADMTALAARMRPIRDAEKEQRAQADREGESAEDRAARMAALGEAVARLASECTVVHLTKIEEDEDAPLYSVTTYREEDAPRNAVRRSLLDALLAVADREPVKACPTCKTVKPLSKFGDLQSSADGRNRCCKVCERARIATTKKRSKARRAAAAPPAVPGA
jgi:hypothetical protein